MPETAQTKADIGSQSAGEILKRCREFQGITLEEAAEITKIGLEYLQALEQNRLQQFSNITYLKGFVRIYANNLGLDPDEMIRLYSKAYTQTDKGTNPNASTDNVAYKRRWIRIPFQKLILPSILLSLILITSAIMNRSEPVNPPPISVLHSPQPIINSAKQPVISSAHTQVVAVKREQVFDDKSDRPAEIAAIEQNAPLEELNRGFIISLKALRNNSLTVTVDAGEAQKQELTAGDRIEWRAHKSVLLELSDAGGVEAFQDGKKLPAFGAEGVSRSVTINAEKSP